MSAIDLVVYADTTLIAGADLSATGASSGLVLAPLKVGGQTAVDIVAFIRALAPKAFDRGTKTKKLAFTVNIEHASVTDALTHALTHDDTISGVADLKLMFTDGATVTTFTARGAAWTATTSAPSGYATETEYQVTCGAFTVTTTAGSPIWWDRAIYGGPVGAARTGFYHGGSARDTHLSAARHFFGGSVADRT